MDLEGINDGDYVGYLENLGIENTLKYNKMKFTHLQHFSKIW